MNNQQMKINYHNKMKEIIKDLDYTPNLLLHSCCGPCSTQVISSLIPYFNITVFYYNPNIEPKEEYLKRKNEQIKFIENYNSNNKLDFLDCDYDNETFKKEVNHITQDHEGGVRCKSCYKLRLKKTAQVAKANDYNYFCTTLTVSPHKDSKTINEIASILEQEYNIKYLYSDFKKEEGYKKSIELAKEYDLYRQDYCGCLYSKNQN